MSPAFVKVRLVSGVTPPTAPLKVIVPDPAAKVSASAPPTVELKVIALLVFVRVLPPVKITRSGNVRGFAPDTVILAPIEMEAALVKDRFVRGADPPIIPENITFPVPATNVRL